MDPRSSWSCCCQVLRSHGPRQNINFNLHTYYVRIVNKILSIIVMCYLEIKFFGVKEIEAQGQGLKA